MAIERFLIIDDSSANQLFFDVLLKDLGYQAKTADHGITGLELIDKEHIQFLIVAWELRGMPGTVLIQKARASRKRRFMPCLIYSKRMSPEDVKLTKELGFEDILAMPFDKEGAKAKVQELIDRENNLSPCELTLRKMESYIYDGKPQEALKLFSEEIFTEPAFKVRAYTTTADMWWRMGKLDKAHEHIVVALQEDPESARAIQIQAKIFSREQRHEEAIELLKKLHQGAPKNISHQVNLGSAYVQADRHEEAKEVFAGVLEVDPDCQSAKDEMVVLAFKEGDMSLASQLVAETEAGDELARIFNNMAIEHIAGERFEQGMQTYQQAIDVLGDKARLHLLMFNMALAYKKKGDLKKAFQGFAETYLYEPGYEKAYGMLAVLAKELKQNGKKPDKNYVDRVKAMRQQHKAG